MKWTKEEVLKALSTVEDPDFKKDLVSLGMIDQVEVSEKKISFTVILTTPACPMQEKIKTDCIDAISNAFGEVNLDINMTAKVTTPRADLDFLPSVKNIIAVASGKGGVGKSTVCVNTALALARQGAKVGIMDADIYGPSIPIMFDLEHARPEVIEIDGVHKIIPIEKYGIKAVSIGFLVSSPQAVVWRGPMVSSAIRQFVTDVEWGELDYLFIDLPPGTGDIHLSIVSMAKPSSAIIVTTPQDVALADARKGIDMFRNQHINIPVLGVVENMSYFTPEEFPDKKYYIFGKGGGKQIASEFETVFLGELPLVPKVREGGDEGMPIVMQGNYGEAASYYTLADKVAQQIAIQNANTLSPETIS